LGDIYVNDAFSASHRKHASIVGVTKYLPSYCGLLFEEELKNLSAVFKPSHPFLLILGGIKFESKLGVLNKFLTIADKIFIGGALAVRALRMPIAKNSKIIFPAGDPAALDANAETLKILKEKIEKAKFILWNGPLGDYEKGFEIGTIQIAKTIASSAPPASPAKRGGQAAKSVIGGGDTIAVIRKAKISLNRFSFVSTAGGAMLEFLAKGTLPGIEALKRQ
ncbi:MAG: phosphoglycerate kinase, partial [Candidatus Parcubacteria bacterium]|nr:phosphoglycerate kinase [Candidatus Parcubacteria bacterium]